MNIKLFDPGPKTYTHLIDRLNRRIDLKYCEYRLFVCRGGHEGGKEPDPKCRVDQEYDSVLAERLWEGS